MSADYTKVETWEQAAPDKRWHALRGSIAAQWLIDHARPDTLAWEAGGTSPFSECVRDVCWRLNADEEPFDLRYPAPAVMRAFNGKVGIVMAMEVVEHIADQNTDDIDVASQFNGSGVTQFLTTCYRMLERGGLLYLTTPNICSAASIVQALDGDHPHIFASHHREYTTCDLLDLIKQAGFRIESYRSIDCYSRSREARKRLPLGLFEHDHLGDTHEVVALKP